MVAANLRNTALAGLQRNLGLVPGITVGRVRGFNPAVGATAETISDGATARFAFPIAAQTLRIAAGGNAADTAAGLGAQSVELTFLDSTYTVVTEVLATAGASASAVTASTAIRLISARVLTSGTYHAWNTAAIVIEHTTSGLDFGTIATATGTMRTGVYSVPAGSTLFITKVSGSIDDVTTGRVFLEVTEGADDVATSFESPGGTAWQLEGHTGPFSDALETYIRVPEKSDVELFGIRGAAADVAVSAGFDFLLVTDAALATF